MKANFLSGLREESSHVESHDYYIHYKWRVTIGDQTHLLSPQFLSCEEYHSKVTADRVRKQDFYH